VSPVDVRSPMGFATATATKPACDGAPPVLGALGFFSGGVGRRRRVRALLFWEGSRGAVVFFYFFRVLFVVWRKQPSMYPPRMVLYFYEFLYVILNYGILKRIIKKISPAGHPAGSRLPSLCVAYVQNLFEFSYNYIEFSYFLFKTMSENWPY